MKIKTHGRVTPSPRGHAVVLGSFQPWQVHHHQLIEELGRHGKETQQPTAVVWMNPSPRTIMGTATTSATAVPTQAQHFLACGVETVFEVSLTLPELQGHAFDFLNELRRHARIEELWIGRRQSLGSGPLGSPEAIRQYCDRAGIRLFRLDDSPT
jgi:FAD synthase